MKIIAEIGINHNGDLELAKQMIAAANTAGCDYVKFQKRTVEKVYTPDELDRPRESPWGTTNRDQKNGLEFGKKEYDEIDLFCKMLKIPWFASPWDAGSVEFLAGYDVPYMKVASPCLTDRRLLEHIKATGIPVILSTGMSTAEEVGKALGVLSLAQVHYLLACTSTYPTCVDELNLNFIRTLKAEYRALNVGYSNHSPGVAPCIAAAALGADMIEFHMTMDRSMYGSDQAASIEPPGMFNLVKNCRNIERALGTGEWTVFESEERIKQKLRRRQ